jgi:putative phosphoribosyl transferase
MAAMESEARFHDAVGETAMNPVARERVPAARARVRVGAAGLQGELVLPVGAGAIVVFAHGSGSSRHSPRNRFMADVLQARGLGTLLFDLLGDAEATDRSNVFDIDLLGRRVTDALDWLAARDDTGGLRVGLFGASTGAAAALRAAAERPARVGAIVSRGGRPDLAGASLGMVHSPTLLIVGGNDTEVLHLNRAALLAMHCSKRLEVVPGASHLFEEPGALDAAAHLAASWFSTHLDPRSGPRL